MNYEIIELIEFELVKKIKDDDVSIDFEEGADFVIDILKKVLGENNE